MLKSKDILIAPYQVAIDVTNKCNLRCLHCYNESGENIQSNNELTDEEILYLVDELCSVGVFNLCFCGGEPLLRKNLIVKCIKKLRESGVPNVAMVTNGILLTEEVACELKEAGLTTIQISLDGATAESHDRLRNKEGVYEKTIQAIKNSITAGIEPNIAYTPTRFNIHEFKEAHSLLRNLGLYDINFRMQPLMLMGRASENLESIKPTEKQYRTLVREINDINEENIKPHVRWGDPVDHLIRFSQMDLSVQQLIIRANGDIVCSTYLPLVVGNIRKHSLLEYWNKGLVDVWSYKIPKKIAEGIRSIEDMNNPDERLPVLWKEEDIFIDIIESDLNDLSLIDLSLVNG